MPLPAILSQQSAASKTIPLKTNWLLYGDAGTGKTHAAFTGRQPIYCQSFDPGGSNLPFIQSMISSGTAIVNTECEAESAKSPRAFEAFQTNFKNLYTAGAFDHIGTYIIDSLTFLSDAAMNFTLKQNGRTFQNPQIQDYGRVSDLLKEIINACCNLPCDFILTGHITTEKDEVNADIITSLVSQGKKIAIKLPTYFDEYYAMLPGKDKKGNPTYQAITKPHMRYRARTRIGSGIFDTFETPNLTYLRKKAGREIENLPPFDTQEKQT